MIAIEQDHDAPSLHAPSLDAAFGIATALGVPFGPVFSYAEAEGTS